MLRKIIVMKENIKISIEYDFSIQLNYHSEENLTFKINKLRNIIQKDTEKFISHNIARINNKDVKFEIE